MIGETGITKKGPIGYRDDFPEIIGAIERAKELNKGKELLYYESGCGNRNFWPIYDGRKYRVDLLRTTDRTEVYAVYVKPEKSEYKFNYIYEPTFYYVVYRPTYKVKWLVYEAYWTV